MHSYPVEDFRSLRVAVLAGGESSERQISIVSGWQVVSALESVGHEPTWIDPAESELESIDWTKYDACFIALHGGAGEDGRVQQRLERLGVPYTSSGPAASWLAMSKSASKERFSQAGVPTPDYALVHCREPAKHTAARAAKIGYPVVVKPDSHGSSLGVGIADSPRRLKDCLSESFALDAYAIVERLVRGREFTVALLGRRPLPLLEVVAHEQLFSFDAKYSSSTTEYRFDTGLPPAIEGAISLAAVSAAAALGTRGLVRVDVMLDERNQPWVLEVNTVPGLTARSLAPQAAERAGITMAALCSWMIHDCLLRETVA
ncbi:MAG TPA: D-alanine--D-alanine ligase [Pirellulales bacterium]|nr:D-alanine--D-alanine ligase [Pirellulales bacterium]